MLYLFRAVQEKEDIACTDVDVRGSLMCGNVRAQQKPDKQHSACGIELVTRSSVSVEECEVARTTRRSRRISVLFVLLRYSSTDE